MGSQKANKTIQAALLEIVRVQDWAVHKLFICSKRAIVRENLLPPFFNIRTICKQSARLVVDKFTSRLAHYQRC